LDLSKGGEDRIRWILILIKDRGELLLEPGCLHYKIKIKGRKSEFDSNLEIAWSPSNLKRSSHFKIQSLKSRSEDRFPDRRTRGGHARKRVAIGHAFAAKTRL